MNGDEGDRSYDGAYRALVQAATTLASTDATLETGVRDAAESFLRDAFKSWKHAADAPDDETRPDFEQYDEREDQT